MREPRKSSPLGKGYVQVYTGNCKGKTTAALGLAFRAMGRGLKTYIGQFMKGQLYGEIEAAKRVSPFITIEQYGKDTMTHVHNPPKEEDLQLAQTGLAKARAAMLSGEYDIVVFDEIFDVAGFHQIVVGPHPHGLDSRIEGGMPGEHDDFGFRNDLFEFGQRFDAVHPRHFHIKDHHIPGRLRLDLL